MPVHSSEQLIRINKLISLQHCQAKLQVFPTLPSSATLSWRKTKYQAGLQRHKPGKGNTKGHKPKENKKNTA